MKAILATKEQVQQDILKISKLYKKQFPDSKEKIGRDFYRANGKYGSSIDNYFGSFKNAVGEIFKKEKGKTREDIDIYKSTNGIKGKRYIISSIIAGQAIDKKFFESIEIYAKNQEAEIILVSMRGINKEDTFSEDVWNTYSKYIVTEYQLNRNLRVADFMLNPSQIVSLTGIARMSKKGQSLIVGTSKLALEVSPSRIGEYPSLTYGTGTICGAQYRNDRVGRIAEIDHTKSGVIVEIVDQTSFHIRNFIADADGGFVDLGTYYKQNKISKINSEIVLGDLHIGDESIKAIEATKQMINFCKCKKVYMNDLFDAKSVNHHDAFNIKAKYKRNNHQKTLKDELNYLGNFLDSFCEKGIEYFVIPSNHNDFISRYLVSGEFVKDSSENCKLACELLSKYLDDIDPIYYYLTSRNFIKKLNLNFSKRNDKLFSYYGDVIHGDMGANGSRGSTRIFDKTFNKSISGHSHSPQIFRSAVRVGCLCNLSPSYIEGSGSSWMHGNCITYANKTFQLINIINGEWKI